MTQTAKALTKGTIMSFKKLAIVATTALALSSSNLLAANIVETADKAGIFKTLLAAAKSAGLAETLSTKGPLTVFAPNDAAFAKLPSGTVENLLKPENKAQLVAILTHHVLGRKLTANMLPGKAIHVKSLNSKSNMLVIEKSDTGVSVGDAMVVSADINADNGVIHVIDTVLIPKAK